jgi:hypothetical protein
VSFVYFCIGLERYGSEFRLELDSLIVSEVLLD